jgi:1,4-dihydroxy-2-naphthoyl-CoA synthase
LKNDLDPTSAHLCSQHAILIDQAVGVCKLFVQNALEARMSDTILTEHFDGWMQITLNRPDRLNAFNDEMHIALSAALAEAEKPEVCGARS